MSPTVIPVKCTKMEICENRSYSAVTLSENFDAVKFKSDAHFIFFKGVRLVRRICSFTGYVGGLRNKLFEHIQSTRLIRMAA